MADMIVLAGSAAVEKAAHDAGHDVTVPFVPGRGDATEEWTDAESFEPLEPRADGFRNYQATEFRISAEELLVDKAHLLGLTVPEMTVLVGGMRALDANTGGARAGVFTHRPGQLTNDFFRNLLTMENDWRPASEDGQVFEAFSRKTGEKVWTGTRVDLVFGSNSQLRAIAEVYAQDDAGEKFAKDFAKAWVKVMNADRVDLH
jgi:catalase-peroxidase